MTLPYKNALTHILVATPLLDPSHATVNFSLCTQTPIPLKSQSLYTNALPS